MQCRPLGSPEQEAGSTELRSPQALLSPAGKQGEASSQVGRGRRNRCSPRGHSVAWAPRAHHGALPSQDPWLPSALSLAFARGELSLFIVVMILLGGPLKRAVLTRPSCVGACGFAEAWQSQRGPEAGTGH